MSRGLVIGVSWYKEQRVVAGPDDRVQFMLDKLVESVPPEARKVVGQYLAPFLEGDEPSELSTFICLPDINLVVWWKRAFVVEDV